MQQPHLTVQFLTPTRICEILHKPLEQVQEVIDSSPDIKPSGSADATPIYNRHALARIRHELNAMDARHDEGDA